MRLIPRPSARVISPLSPNERQIFIENFYVRAEDQKIVQRPKEQEVQCEVMPGHKLAYVGRIQGMDAFVEKTVDPAILSQYARYVASDHGPTKGEGTRASTKGFSCLYYYGARQLPA